MGVGTGTPPRPESLGVEPDLAAHRPTWEGLLAVSLLTADGPCTAAAPGMHLLAQVEQRVPGRLHLLRSTAGTVGRGDGAGGVCGTSAQGRAWKELG